MSALLRLRKPADALSALLSLLMCAPMLLVVAGYLWAGRASLAAGGVLAALVPAISCMIMMWLMMRMMDHGSQH